MFDPTRGVNKVHRIVVVFFNACGNRKNIGIENDVFRWEVHLIHQDAVGAFTNFFLACKGIGLAFFIKRHHHSCGAIAFNQGGLSFELFHAFFHANGVNDAFTLDTAQTCFYHRPFARVDHHWNTRNVGLARHQI